MHSNLLLLSKKNPLNSKTIKFELVNPTYVNSNFRNLVETRNLFMKVSLNLEFKADYAN